MEIFESQIWDFQKFGRSELECHRKNISEKPCLGESNFPQPSG